MHILPYIATLGADDESNLSGMGVYISRSIVGPYDDNTLWDLKNVPAVGVGFSSRLWLNNLPIHVGVGLSPKIWEMKRKQGDTKKITINKVNYVDLWMRLSFSAMKCIIFSDLNVGTYINGKRYIEESDASFQELKTITEEDISIDEFGMDFGISFGLGYQIDKLQVNLKYIRGLSEPSEDIKFYGTVLSLGYEF
tara:strand:- start:874 stop:1458 length:585 start_codon:yes stop_codon:yes gene_type:complete